MGLMSGDLEKVPKNFSRRDCYRRIYKWHKKFGKRRLEEIRKKYQIGVAYVKAYLDLLKELPRPDEVSEECMDFVFGEIIYMLMEWSYHEVDEFGIKIGAYAHFAVNQKYGKTSSDDFWKSQERCYLYARFGKNEWEKYYK